MWEGRSAAIVPGVELLVIVVTVVTMVAFVATTADVVG